jgi:choline kinase
MDPTKAGSIDQTTQVSHAAASSPSPSPALSAYSSTTSNSSFDNDNDYDLNSLSLDDWGYPQRNADATSPERSGRKISPTNTVQAQDSLDGASTPIAKRHPLSSLIHGAKSSFPFHRKSVNDDTTTDDPSTPLVEDEEDDEELEPTGFDVEDEDEEDMHAHGVPAARGWRLKANKAKTPAFRSQVLAMFSTQLKLETWSDDTVDPVLLPLKPENVGLKRISGAFSNAVFFVSYNVPSEVKASGPRTVLLRVYGSGTEVLLSRRTELLILHTLSSLYEIGPHILGTFANGRVETYFDAEPIGKDGMRDLGDRRETLREDGSLLIKGKEGRAQWVARRMRQLHEVPLDTMRAVLEQGDLRTGSGAGSSLFGRGIENHLFARSHRPIMSRNKSSAPQQQLAHLDGRFLPGQMPRDSPAPMTPGDGSAVESSIEASGADGVRVQAMAIRGHSTQHRANSVASFDSLATSYNSQDGGSVSSDSTDDLLISPSLGPSSFSESLSAARRGHDQSPYTFRKPNLDWLHSTALSWCMAKNKEMGKRSRKGLCFSR